MSEPLELGRYTLFAELASGGMATVYLARLNGEVGFGRTVAIKRLHPHMAREPEFVAMFLDEARMAARVQHPNVVGILDVVATGKELFLVMEYVQGESLSALLKTAIAEGQPMPVDVAASIAIGYLSGLHAAHEATDERGRPLGIVHRDVSPQNVLLGADGVARLLDFGVAKALGRLQTTREGQLKGKLAYMPPEQLDGAVTRQTDVYAAGIVLWESIAGKRLFRGDSDAELFVNVMTAEVPPLRDFNLGVSDEVEAVVRRAIARDPRERWETAHEMAEALDAALRPASTMTVATWVRRAAAESLATRAELVADAEAGRRPAAPFPDLQTSGDATRVDRPSGMLSSSELHTAPGDVGTATSTAVVQSEVTHPASFGGARPRRGGRALALGFGTVLALGLAIFFFPYPGGDSQPGQPPAATSAAARSVVSPAAPDPSASIAAASWPAWQTVGVDASTSRSAVAALPAPAPASSTTGSNRPSRAGNIGHRPVSTRPDSSSDLNHLLDTR
jgi:serine/threonine protein kinase